jgi:hypothetical protein
VGARMVRYGRLAVLERRRRPYRAVTRSKSPPGLAIQSHPPIIHETAAPCSVRPSHGKLAIQGPDSFKPRTARARRVVNYQDHPMAMVGHGRRPPRLLAPGSSYGHGRLTSGPGACQWGPSGPTRRTGRHRRAHRQTSRGTLARTRRLTVAFRRSSARARARKRKPLPQCRAAHGHSLVVGRSPAG